jgi:MSHA biogenesis protein MshO
MQAQRHHYSTNQSGFNLIELTVVIVVLAIISAGTASYIVDSMRAYSDSARREQITSEARTALERVVRELRNALPNSIRIQTDVTGGITTHCIEFFPVKRGSAYLDLNTSAATVSFSAVPFTSPGAGNHYVVIYPYATTPLYASSNPGLLTGFNTASNTAAGEVLLSNPHRFNLASARKRFYITENPVSFCINSGNQSLNRYNGYGVNINQSSPPAGTVGLLANNIWLLDNGTNVIPFTYSAGSLSRAAVVKLDFRFMQNGEWVRLTQEVQIRNAP